MVAADGDLKAKQPRKSGGCVTRQLGDALADLGSCAADRFQRMGFTGLDVRLGGHQVHFLFVDQLTEQTGAPVRATRIGSGTKQNQNAARDFVP